MSRQNLSPFSVLLAGIVVIALLMFDADPRSSAIGRAQDDDYPAQTATAAALTATAAADYPVSSPTGDTTATITVTGTPATVTPTPTGTPSPTVGQTGAIPTPTPTEQPSTTDTVAEEAATETPSNERECIPGQPIEIAGNGPPRAAYLLYFGDRPVGGGSIEADGTFLAKLILGLERAGDYSVTVRVRGTTQVLRELSCAVPEVTPTPLPQVRPPR
jgi:hypothetical protein